MSQRNSPSADQNRKVNQRSLDYLRKRSLHRTWWKSARVTLRRESLAQPGRPSGDKIV